MIGAGLRNDIYDRPPLRRWGEGPVTLLGDAAHPMTPNLGQGACQALEDAVVLGDCLRGADDMPRALRSYEARRIPRTTAIVERSWRLGRMAQWENALGCSLRYFRWHAPDRLRRSVEELFWWYGEGKLRPCITHRLPLERSVEAIRLLTDRKAHGKIVVVPGER